MLFYTIFPLFAHVSSVIAESSRFSATFHRSSHIAVVVSKSLRHHDGTNISCVLLCQVDARHHSPTECKDPAGE